MQFANEATPTSFIDSKCRWKKLLNYNFTGLFHVSSC